MSVIMEPAGIIQLLQRINCQEVSRYKMQQVLPRPGEQSWNEAM